jgi:hypothetical protein
MVGTCRSSKRLTGRDRQAEKGGNFNPMPLMPGGIVKSRLYCQ